MAPVMEISHDPKPDIAGQPRSDFERVKMYASGGKADGVATCTKRKMPRRPLL